MKEVLGELVDFIISSNYAHAILILFLFILGARLLLYFFKHVLEKLARKTPTEMDDKIVVTMETPLVVIMILIGIQLAAKRILLEGIFFEQLLQSLMIIITTIMFIGIINIVITYWAKGKEKKDNDEFHQEVQPLVKSLSKLLLIGIAIMVILQMWGVQVGTTLASLGVIGVVLGFAFQDTMKNIFGGISLIVDDSIHKKDVIRLESGEMGEIVEVNLRSTKIKTFDSEYLIIPNGVLSTTKITNLAEPTPTLRIDIPVSVAYGNDPAHVMSVLLGSLKGNQHILKFPKREARFIKMNESSMDFMLLFFISNFRDKFDIENEIMVTVYNSLQEHKIRIPFPARTIYKGEDMDYVSPTYSGLREVNKTKNSPRKKTTTKKTTHKKRTQKNSSTTKHGVKKKR